MQNPKTPLFDPSNVNLIFLQKVAEFWRKTPFFLPIWQKNWRKIFSSIFIFSFFYKKIFLLLFLMVVKKIQNPKTHIFILVKKIYVF